MCWRRPSSGSRCRTSGLGAADGARRVDPVEALRVFFRSYTPADKDWAFQLWLDAWAEAARRPALQATSRRLNLAWQALLERTIRDGRRRRVVPVRRSVRRRRGGSCRCSTGWRSRSWPTARPSRAPMSWPGRPAPPRASWDWRQGRSARTRWRAWSRGPARRRRRQDRRRSMAPPRPAPRAGAKATAIALTGRTLTRRGRSPRWSGARWRMGACRRSR